MDSAQLNACLTELLQPDTERIKATEAMLKPYLKDPTCLGGLLQQVQSNPNPGVRQIAAVVLRKRIPGHWGKLDAGSQATVQQAILAVLQSEAEKVVRKAVVTVACAVARPCFAHPATRWMMLLEFVNACCGAPQDDARDMGFLIVEHLADTIGTSMEEAVPTVTPLLLRGLADASPPVQAQALRATGALMSVCCDTEMAHCFVDLLPPILAVLRARLASGDEDIVGEVLEVLDDLAQVPTPLLNKHIPALVGFLLEMVKAEGLEGGVRDQAGMLLNTLVECKPKLLGKSGLVPPILEAMVHLMAACDESCAGSLNLALADNEHDPADGKAEDDDEEDEGDASIATIAQSCIDRLGTSLPQKYVWEPGYAAAAQCLGSGESKWRKAGASCLGNLAEGCRDNLCEVLPAVVPLLLAVAGDPDKYAREAAMFCFGQLAEHCQPDIMRYQEAILPAVFALLDDPLQSVQGISCYVLESISEHLTVANVGPLLPGLTARLLTLAQSPRLSIREMAFSALASTAAAAEGTFAPYAHDVVGVLAVPLQLSEERYFTLRGRALECLGHVAIAVGKDGFAPYLPLGMASAEQSLHLDAPELHEFTYAFFGTVAKVIGADFAPFLPTLVPHLCEVVVRSDGEERTAGGEGGYDLSALNDEDEADEDEDGTFLVVRTALLDSKRTACIALGMIAENTGPAFATGGHLAPALNALIGQREYFHDAVRREVVTALARLVRAAVVGGYGSLAGLPKYTPGDLTRTVETLAHEGIAVVSNAVVKALTAVLLEDENKGVCAVACEGLQSVLELLGPAVLAPVMVTGWTASEGEEPNKLTGAQALLALLRETAPCQRDTTEVTEAGDPEEDEGDHDSELMDSVSDLVGGFSKAFGAAFAPLAAEVIDAMMKYAKGGRPASDRAMAIGCFAEIMQYMGPAAAPHVPSLAPCIQAGLADSSMAVRRNACFAAGVLGATSPDALKPHFPALLAAITPCFTVSHEMDGALVDNAASAVCRLIKAGGPDSLPLDAALPLLLGALPLKIDFTENDNVYDCLGKLLAAKPPALLPLLPQALVASAHGVGAEVSPETRAVLVAGLKALAADPAAGPTVAAALGQIPPEAAALLRAALA